MSQMSPPAKIPRLKKPSRLKKIMELLPQAKTRQEIADACGVNEKTIDRDIKDWEESGGFEKWLRAEFFALHREVRDASKEVAYKTIASLLERTLKQKVEAEGQVKVVVEMSGLEADRPAAGAQDKG